MRGTRAMIDEDRGDAWPVVDAGGRGVRLSDGG